MRAFINSNGTVSIVFEGTAEQVILEKVLGIKVGQNTPLMFTVSKVNEDGVVFTSTQVAFDTAGMNLTQFEDVLKSIREKMTLDAVKKVKEYTNLGLKEAKDLVDNIRHQMNL